MTMYTTPKGRIVQGHPMKMQQGEDQTKKPCVFFAVALPKSDPETDNLVRSIRLQARKELDDAVVDAPSFAWKLVDGDDTTPNSKGVAPKDREGHPGHMIIKFTTFLPGTPACCDKSGQALINENQIKVGDYVRVKFSVKPHLGMHPGLYINPEYLLLESEGEAISNKPKAPDVWGLSGTMPTPDAPPNAPPPGAKPARYNLHGTVYTLESLTQSGWTVDKIIAAGGMLVTD